MKIHLTHSRWESWVLPSNLHFSRLFQRRGRYGKSSMLALAPSPCHSGKLQQQRSRHLQNKSRRKMRHWSSWGSCWNRLLGKSKALPGFAFKRCFLMFGLTIEGVLGNICYFFYGSFKQILEYLSMHQATDLSMFIKFCILYTLSYVYFGKSRLGYLD